MTWKLVADPGPEPFSIGSKWTKENVEETLKLGYFNNNVVFLEGRRRWTVKGIRIRSSDGQVIGLTRQALIDKRKRYAISAREAGGTYENIAKELGVTPMTVRHLVRRKPAVKEPTPNASVSP